MECQDVKNRLSAYMEELLPSGEKELVRHHLLKCKTCSALLQELQGTHNLLKNLEEIEPPPWLTQRIMSRVKEEKEQRFRFFKKLFYPFPIKIPVQVLGVIVVVVVVFQIYRELEPTVKPGTIPPLHSPLAEKNELKQKPLESFAKTGKPIAGRGNQPAPPRESTILNQESEQAPGGVSDEGKTLAEAGTVSPQVSEPTGKEKTFITDNVPDLSRARVATEGTKPSGKPPAETIPPEREKTEEIFSQKTQPEPSTPAFKKESRQPVFPGGQQLPPLAIGTDDVVATQHRVEEILRQLGGKNIENSAKGSLRVITGELPHDKTKELFQQLHGIGDLVKTPSLSELPKGAVQVRIEISPKIPQ